MPKPNFFIVGAPKSGTTAIYEYLKSHPKVCMANTKELHFFGTDLEFRPPSRNFVTVPRSVEETQRYLSFFECEQDVHIIGEASVNYLVSEQAAKEIKSFNPSSKILIMLRNPVDLLHSLHSQYLWEGNEDVDDFQEALSLEADRQRGFRLPSSYHFQLGLQYRKMIQFASQVERYISSFGSKNVLILFFEEFSANPRQSYEQTLDFLGLNYEAYPSFEKINANKRVRSRALVTLLRNPPPLMRHAAHIIPGSLRSQLVKRITSINTHYTRREPLPEILRAELMADFKPEIMALGELLGRDMSVWLQPVILRDN